MPLAYLNGDLVPLQDARISPLDRGFLFGDGVYEVVPVHCKKPVGWDMHMARMASGLREINLIMPLDVTHMRSILNTLVGDCGAPYQGFYLHVSRGPDALRKHGFPDRPKPTVFAFCYEIDPPVCGTDETIQGYRVITQRDLRWQRCHIKSTSLLGNVLHYQNGQTQQAGETLLFNERDELTEGSTCNVFIVCKEKILTPALDHQKLPGITRAMLLEILRKYSDYDVVEETLTAERVSGADEVWLTSSTKELQPVTLIDDQPVGNGQVGPVWRHAKQLFDQHKYAF